MGKITKAFLSLICICMLTSCISEAPIKKELEIEQAVTVKMITVTNNSASIHRKFPALVESFDEAQLAFRVPGQLKSMLVSAGEEVKKGEVIAELDNRDYAIELNKAKAHHKLANAQYKRTMMLHEQKLISATRFGAVTAELETAKARLDAAMLNLEHTRLRAPFDGQISRRHVENFTNIQVGQDIVSLVVIEKIDVSFQVSEYVFANLKNDVSYQPEVFFNAGSGRAYLANFKEFDSISDPATQTYRMVFTLDAPTDFNVLPGMSATVVVNSRDVLQNQTSTLAVPVGAVFGGNNTPDSISNVWIVNSNDRLEKRVVTVASINGNKLAIDSGLVVGEKIIAAGVHRLKQGQLVKRWKIERGV